MNHQVKECRTCCWARIHDRKVFCLFTTCLKRDRVFRNALGIKKKPAKNTDSN